MKARRFSQLLQVLGIAMICSADTSADFVKSHYDEASGFHYLTYDGPPIPPIGDSFEAATIVTTQEAGVDAIYSSAPFGVDPIDMAYAAPLTVTGITNIGNAADFTAVTSNPSPTGNTINMWFVDTIDYCGGLTDPSIIGCAGGLVNVVEAAFAALGASPGNGGGVELIGHELGHNLGLPHVGAPSPATNLMNPAINGNISLVAGQAATVQGAFQVNGTAPNRFVNIQPISITAVPEPSSVAFFFLAGLLVVCQKLKPAFVNRFGNATA